MTSEERHEARFQRRKALRESKRKERMKDALDFDKVFTYQHMYRSAWYCFRGVRWKASVQRYKSRCGINVARKLRDMRNGNFELKRSPEFFIRERGHLRRINSICIDDRVPQKCLCKYSLKPVLHPTLIYDNYASQEGKGTSKARKRLKCMLERHVRKYGLNGGIITLDIRKFFDSIPHDLVKSVLNQYYEDERLINYNMRVVQRYRDDVGLVLGSENSQDFAIATPSSLDHYIKEKLGVSGYGRYMDDAWIIHPDFEYLKVVWEKIKAFAAQLGFELNEKKSRLLHFGEQFTILKRKYSFPNETGRILIRPASTSVVRERRKIKRLSKKYYAGQIPFETCQNSVQAWKSSIAGTKCHRIVTSIDELFDQLLIKPWLIGKEQGEQCSIKSYPTDGLSMSVSI